MHYIQNQKT